MAYPGAVIEQQWTPGEVKAYCAEKFESKTAGLFSENKTERSVNSKGNLSKAQYIRFKKKGVSDEDILAKYQDLTPGRLEMAKKR